MDSENLLFIQVVYFDVQKLEYLVSHILIKSKDVSIKVTKIPFYSFS